MSFLTYLLFEFMPLEPFCLQLRWLARRSPGAAGALAPRNKLFTKETQFLNRKHEEGGSFWLFTP